MPKWTSKITGREGYRFNPKTPSWILSNLLLGLMGSKLKGEFKNMDENSIYDVWNYNKENSDNLQNQISKVMEIVNDNFTDIITSSFKKGYKEGEMYGRSDESQIVKAKICSKLFSNTNLTNEEIYNILGFGEEKWKGYISEFRRKYEEGKIEGLKGQDKGMVTM